MPSQESTEERKKRFKAMSSDERKALIRKRMKDKGLEEGSGVPWKNLSSYDRNEIWDLIQVTSCFPEMQTKPNRNEVKAPNKKKSLLAWIIIAMALSSGMVSYCHQYPSPETRRELSVDGIFADLITKTRDLVVILFFPTSKNISHFLHKHQLFSVQVDV